MAPPLVGTPIRRVEDHHLLTGNSTFVANRPLDDALVVHFVTSAYAHAVIERIDTSDAARMPGVVDVVTAAELDAEGFGGPMAARFPGIPDAFERHPLARDVVRFVGEPVVAIVAVSATMAADAAETVVIDYQPRPAVVDPGTAGAADTWLFPAAGTNVVMEASGADAEPPDLSGCEVVADVTTVNQRLAPCPIETRVAAAFWTDDGRLVQYASCQGAHPVRAGLAGFYGIPTDRVRVVTADVGGSFGSKAGPYPEELLLGLLARRAGRPVRWIPDRTVDMIGLGHSRAQIQRITVGGRRDGTIEAIRAEITGDCGAYPVAALALLQNAGMVLPGPFAVSRVHWSGKVVVTNTTPVAAYRGAGRPEGGALLNRGIDAFARAAGIDTLDVMRTNLIPVGEMPWTSPNGVEYDSGDYSHALELAASVVGHADIRARQARERAENSTSRTGIGWAGFIDRTGGYPGDDWGSVELRADGSLLVLTSSSPYGQGHYTAWAMLVADRTGVPVDRIEVFHGDTDVVPKGGVTGGSRSAQRAGVAVSLAADEFVERARERAAQLLEAAIDDIVLDRESGTFHVAGARHAATVDWGGLASRWSDSTVGDGTLLRCESDAVADGASIPFGMYAAVVTVDTETGGVTLDRLVSVDDAGTVINPMLVEGQLHGGIGQGIGQALYEEFVYDDHGNPLTASFLDYAVPSAAEMPSFEVSVVQYPSPNNPLGAKGIAESGTIGAVPAVQNAVIDAIHSLGVDHVDIPLTPERVWRAIHPG